MEKAINKVIYSEDFIKRKARSGAITMASQPDSYKSLWEMKKERKGGS